MPDFECRLKKYRLLKDLTQEQLAAQVGVRRETIMRLEKAQYNPSLKLAIDISRVVEAPIEEIFVFKRFLRNYAYFIGSCANVNLHCLPHSSYHAIFDLPRQRSGTHHVSMKSKNSQKTERLFTGRISNQTSCSQTDYLQMGEKFVRSRR